MKLKQQSTICTFVCAIIIAICVNACACGGNTSNTGEAKSEDEESIVNPKKEWDFRFTKDEMTDATNIYAGITSENTIEQDFPYGTTSATITVRHTEKFGYEALFSISSGQIFGSSYEGTDYLTVRFGEEQPIKYKFIEASDGSSETVFIRNASDFIERCKNATAIKVDVPLFQGGRPVFKFTVDEPLVWREE